MTLSEYKDSKNESTSCYTRLAHYIHVSNHLTTLQYMYYFFTSYDLLKLPMLLKFLAPPLAGDILSSKW
jgi:hypothetical protein